MNQTILYRYSHRPSTWQFLQTISKILCLSSSWVGILHCHCHWLSGLISISSCILYPRFFVWITPGIWGVKAGRRMAPHGWDCWFVRCKGWQPIRGQGCLPRTNESWGQGTGDMWGDSGVETIPCGPVSEQPPGRAERPDTAITT